MACLALTPQRLSAQGGVELASSAQVAPSASSPTPVESSPATVEACIDAHVQFQLHERAQRWSEALLVSRGCSDPHCPEEIRADCVAWSRAVDQRMPSVRVMVEAEPQLPVELWLDGESLGVATAPITLHVDPGAHEIAASQAGHTARVNVTLAPSEKREVTLVLRSGAQTHAAHSDGLDWWQWSVGGVGSVALVAFAVLGIQAQQAQARASANCAPLCTEDTVQRINQRALGADLALGVAALSGLVLWASWPSTQTPGSTVAIAPVAETVTGIRVDTYY